jgi:hypothetical protein
VTYGVLVLLVPAQTGGRDTNQCQERPSDDHEHSSPRQACPGPQQRLEPASSAVLSSRPRDRFDIWEAGTRYQVLVGWHVVCTRFSRRRTRFSRRLVA